MMALTLKKMVATQLSPSIHIGIATGKLLKDPMAIESSFKTLVGAEFNVIGCLATANVAV